MGNKRAGFSTAGIKDPAVKAAFDRVAEILQTYDGVRGDSLDRVVTLRDLVGTTDLAALARRYGGVGGGLVDAIGGDSGEEDTTPPPAPSNLAAAGAFNGVILSWDFSAAYSNLSHFEVLRADADNYAQAVVVATTAAHVHADPIGLSADKYYWVRAVSRANVAGPANAVAGTQGRTADDPVAITELLTQRPWQAATFVRQYYVVAPTVPVSFGGVQAVFQATNAGVTGGAQPNWSSAGAIGGTVVDNGVTWEAIEPGKAPLVIGTVNGQAVVALSTALIQDASITNAKVLSLAADKLYAESGTIANAIIGTGHILNAMIGGAIYSDNYVTGSQGWLINKNGQFELNGGTIRGALHVGGHLSGTTGDFNGTVYVQNLEGDVFDKVVQDIWDGPFIGWQDCRCSHYNAHNVEVITISARTLPRYVTVTGLACAVRRSIRTPANQIYMNVYGGSSAQLLAQAGPFTVQDLELGTDINGDGISDGPYVFSDKRFSVTDTWYSNPYTTWRIELTGEVSFTLPANTTGYIWLQLVDAGPDGLYGSYGGFARASGSRVIEAYKQATTSIYWSSLP